MTGSTTPNPYWVTDEKSYIQPCVINPPNGQNANNARMAIWHFARPHTLLRFENADRYDPQCLAGKFDRGEAVEHTVHIEVQPLSNKEYQEISGKEWERTEAMICVHYDPFQPENQGLFFRLADDRFPDAPDTTSNENVVHELPKRALGFSDVIVYRGELWKMVYHEFWHSGGDEEIDGNYGGVEIGVFALWRDYQQEREANSENSPEYVIGTANAP